MKEQEIEEIEQARSYLETETLVKIAHDLLALANNYLARAEREFDQKKTVAEMMVHWQSAKAADLLSILGHIFLPKAERKIEDMRKETINWSNNEHFHDAGDKYSIIFRAAYEHQEIAFGVPITHNNIRPTHIGFVQLTFRPQGEGEEESVHTFLLDRNAVIDWQLGLSFIASRELRSPYSETMLTEDDIEQKGDDEDTAA